MTTSQPAFSYTHTVETDVAAAEIWALYEDVSTWPLWDEQASVSLNTPTAVIVTTGFLPRLIGQLRMQTRETVVYEMRFKRLSGVAN